MNNRAFFKEFTFSEFRSILHEGRGKISILFFLLFISFLSIGIGYGSKIFLNDKLKDPFIKFIDITNPTSEIPGKPVISLEQLTNEEWCWFGDNIEESHKENSTNCRKDSCLSDTVTTWNEYLNFEGPFAQKYTWLEFGNSGWYTGHLHSSDSVQMFKIAVINDNDVFYEKIKEIPRGDDFSRLSSEDINLSMEDFGCIVTEKVLNDLQLQGIEVEFSNLAETPFYIEILKGNVPIPIKVTGVVKNLRAKVDILISPYTFWAISASSNFHFNTPSPTYLRYFVNNGDVGNKFDTDTSFTTLKKRGFTVLESFKNGSGIITLNQDVDLQQDLSLVHQFQNKNPNIKMLRIFDIENNYHSSVFDIKTELIFDELTVMLNSLDGASNLAKMLEQTYGIEINKTEVENKKNFSFFGNLITILSISLIFFSIMSIIFFITNLLLSHIESNKKSLGTLKAFGLPSASIVFTYSTITLAIVFLCFVFSYGLSELCGDLVLDLFSKLINDSSGYLNLVEFSGLPIWLNLICFIVVPTCWVCLKIYKYLYNITPGDLIYNRKQ